MGNSILVGRFLGLGAGVVFLLLALGLAIPKFLIGDGLRNLSLSDREAGQEALEDAITGCRDNPINRISTLKARVIRVSTANKDSPEPGPRVLVRTYSWFGIPSGVISVGPTLTVCDT